MFINLSLAQKPKVVSQKTSILSFNFEIGFSCFETYRAFGFFVIQTFHGML